MADDKQLSNSDITNKLRKRRSLAAILKDVDEETIQQVAENVISIANERDIDVATKLVFNTELLGKALLQLPSNKIQSMKDRYNNVIQNSLEQVKAKEVAIKEEDDKAKAFLERASNEGLSKEALLRAMRS